MNYIGIDIGGTNLKAGLTDENGRLLAVKSMKIDRMIGILSLLLQREKVTTPELAEHFEVSKRHRRSWLLQPSAPKRWSPCS